MSDAARSFFFQYLLSIECLSFSFSLSLLQSTYLLILQYFSLSLSHSLILPEITSQTSRPLESESIIIVIVKAKVEISLCKKVVVKRRVGKYYVILEARANINIKVISLVLLILRLVCSSFSTFSPIYYRKQRDYTKTKERFLCRFRLFLKALSYIIMMTPNLRVYIYIQKVN